MRFRLLGPVDLLDGDRTITVPKPRSRAVLAFLLLSANRMVTTDALVDAVWQEKPPATARNQIQLDISVVRRAIREAGLRDPITTTSSGYRIGVADDELDLLSFEALRRAARDRAADPAAAAGLLREALELWRGQPLGDVAGAFVGAAREALTDRYLTTVEDWADAGTRTGRQREVVPELSGLVRQHPLREGLSRQLALALHRDGRTGEALATLRALRTALAEELGVDMAPATSELETSILRADAPPAGPTVNALPRSASTFTGREPELRTLDRLLPAGGSALVTVTGSGGIGKTALALHWARGAAARYPDGLLYVDLGGFSERRPLSPTEALSRLLHQLGVAPARIPVHEEHAADLYRTSVAGRRVLAVLDNARDSDQVRPLLAAGAGCGTLVTSRARLSGLVARDGAAALDLDVFSPPEARALLTALLGAEQEADLDELARMCAYVPLALRIAAAAILAQPHGIAAYLARMRSADRLEALRLDGDDHTAMSTTLAYSYDLLESDTRRLFRLLSLVPGLDVTADTAADLAGLPAGQTRALLTKLVAVHLVEERAPGRFGFHDLLRLFAALQADADGPAALDRLYAHYASRVEAAARRLYPQILRLPDDTAQPHTFDTDADAVAWLDAERFNLAAAVTRGCEQGPRRPAWTIANNLRGYFFIRMFVVQWHAVAHAALRAAEADGDERAQAAAQLNLADLGWRQGDLAGAEAAFHLAEQHAAAGRWPAGEATALGNLGGMRRMQGRLTDAVVLLERSLRLNIEIDRTEGQLVNLGNLGVTYGELGDWQRSEDYLVRTQEICERLGSRSGQAVSLSNLVETAIHLGDLDLAETRQAQALALHRQLGDKAAEASTIRSEAVLRLRRGDLEGALAVANTAVDLARESDDHRVLAHCLHVTATVLDARGDTDAALETAEQAAKLAHEAGHRFVETRALLGLARIHGSRHEPEHALARAREALALAEECGYRELAADATGLIGSAGHAAS
ncbi:MAG TPA: BTAD domain-containing putative transcriptional regulator [Asanoa sp.]|nr:BTAD domain-containing putative transcriptional regulator [Asanoa sp.]